MDDVWKRQILRASRRASERETDQFLELVDAAMGKCDLDTARTLMKTFTAEPDFGTQERVVSVLASSHRENAIIALLEELPRLIKEAPEWAVTLIGTEVTHRPDMLGSVASRMPNEIQETLRNVMRDDEFLDFYPEARNVRF